MRKYISPLVLAGSLGAYLFSPAQAEPVAPKPDVAAPAKNSVDDQLRRRLDQDLLEGLGDVLPPDAKPSPGPAKPGEKNRPTRTDLDQQLLDDLGDPGEGDLTAKDPLARIGANMRTAEKLIAGKNTSDETQKLQEGIVKDLALLIKELEKQAQCQGGQCQKPGQPSSAQQAKQPQPSKPGNSPASQASNNPARESTAELRERDAKPVETAVVEHARRKAWGNLPERLRQQLQNAASEEFLPQYTSQIEDYFERLAETPKK